MCYDITNNITDPKYYGIPIKYIVKRSTVHNYILMDLWSVSTGYSSSLENGTANSVIKYFPDMIYNPNTTIMDIKNICRNMVV